MSDENEMLRENLEAQTERVDQRLYLQELRGDMTGDLRELTSKVSKMLAGASLVTKLGITNKSPKIIEMFHNNDTNALKDKRNEIETNMKLGKLSLEVGNRQKLEVLTALRHLGCELTDSDKMFIREETSKLQSSMPSNGFNISDYSNDSI